MITGQSSTSCVVLALPLAQSRIADVYCFSLQIVSGMGSGNYFATGRSPRPRVSSTRGSPDGVQEVLAPIDGLK